MQNKDVKGRFINKSADFRKVRSIRATDKIWNTFGEEAKQLSITRADLLEQIFSEIFPHHAQKNNNCVIHGRILEIIEILKLGITSKKQGGFYAANNAKALKEEVFKAIALLEDFKD